MANIKSALKRAQIARIRMTKNAAYKSMIKTAIRSFETALQAGELENAKEKLLKVTRIVDKLAGKGVIPKNTAARKKSRLSRKLNQTAS